MTTSHRAGPLKCPKCGRDKLLLDESILIMETRQLQGMEMSDVLDAEPVSTIGYDARCDNCGNQWRPRRSTVDAYRSATARATT